MGVPGSALFGTYDVDDTNASSDGTAAGDSILRLINPAGNANRGFGVVTNKCAMIYVFDDDEEMGECCGCPITPAQEASFSFEYNLLDNWIGVRSSTGIVAVRAATINDNGCRSFRNPGQLQPGCNGGCDPTDNYQTLSNNLLGSITHVQSIDGSPSNITEVALFDDGPGDPADGVYLIEQCAALIGNGSGAGICNCPLEFGSGL